MPSIILIAGPTASGKSAVALKLAERRGGTIINADSMQVYRDLRIITARPTPDEERRAPHRLTGMSMRRRTIRWAAGAAKRRQRWRRRSASSVPAIIVGGTGLYFSALGRGLAAVPPVPAEIRDDVRARLAKDGVAALHAELAGLDPAAAAQLRPADRARVTRALEVVLATGRSLLDWHRGEQTGNRRSAGAARVS